MPGDSTFRIKCGDDGFHQDSLVVPHQSSIVDLHRPLAKVPRASNTGEYLASMSSILHKWLLREVAALALSPPKRKELQRLQIVLFTLRES